MLFFSFLFLSSGAWAKTDWIVPVRRGKSNKMTAQLSPLSDQVALITGAGRGIGRAIALRLAQAGAKTVLAARTEQELRETAQSIQASGGQALSIPTDVQQAEQLTTLVEKTLAQYERIDILVNNAGGGPPRTSIVKSRLTDWEHVLQVNLFAAMSLTRHILPSMIARRHGTIIMLGSIASLTGRAGEAAYAASKFGLRGFTQSLFEEVRRYGIKVSLLCPGGVDTTLIPYNKRLERGKLLSPNDVAEAAYNIVAASPRACPAEVILQPQFEPFQ